jgi:hypothetical protein
MLCKYYALAYIGKVEGWGLFHFASYTVSWSLSHTEKDNVIWEDDLDLTLTAHYSTRLSQPCAFHTGTHKLISYIQTVQVRSFDNVCHPA